MAFPLLYPIIDADVCRARAVDAAGLAGALLEGGARLLQLRWKAQGSAGFLALADRLQALVVRFGAQLVVNDRPDIALLCGAAGAHVGQEDLPVADVRRLLGPEAVVGISTHTPAQLDEALESEASYVAVGPVFGTATKDTGYTPRGLELVRQAAGRGKPVVAIGGITLETAPSVFAAGASSVAVISDLMTADPRGRAARYLEVLRPVIADERR